MKFYYRMSNLENKKIIAFPRYVARFLELKLFQIGTLYEFYNFILSMNILHKKSLYAAFPSVFILLYTCFCSSVDTVKVRE